MMVIVKINKNQAYLSSRFENFKFDLKRGNGHLFSYILDRIRWHIYPRINKVSEFPTHIDIELSSACNLNCPMCYTTTDEFKSNVKRVNLDLELFKKIVDECAKYRSHYSIRLSWRGESFLNPQIFEMIKYAKEKKIKEVSTLTHGGFLTPEKFEELCKLGLDWLTISFDGTGETYEQVRAPLKFEKEVEKIKNYKEIKKKLKTIKPIIKVQGVWPAIEKNPEKYFDTFKPITDQVASLPLLDYLRKDTDIDYIENFDCPVIYQRMTIASTGEVKLCYNDEMGQVNIGDVNFQTVKEIWHGELMTKAREIHKKHKGVEEYEPCKHCFYPRKSEIKHKKVKGKNVALDGVTKRSQNIGT